MAKAFSIRAERAIVLAQEYASRWKHEFVEPVHLLAALVGIEDGKGYKILMNRGLSLPKVQERALSSLQSRTEALPNGSIPFTDEAKSVLTAAFHESHDMGHGFVGTGHLLIGLFAPKSSEMFLKECGVDYAAVREDYLREIGPQGSCAPEPGQHGPD